MGSTFTGNTTEGEFGGGAIENFDTLKVSGTTFKNNSASTGGGILNSAGTVTVDNSTLADNSATAGGGIDNYGDLKATSVTVSGNQSQGGPGGGGIVNEAGASLSFSQSTVSTNQAIACARKRRLWWRPPELRQCLDRLEHVSQEPGLGARASISSVAAPAAPSTTLAERRLM